MLGTKRDTGDEQANYLIKLASQYQGIATNALAANYWSHDAFEKEPALRIATLVVERNELLSCHFQACGHEYKFEAKDAEEESSTSWSKIVKCGVGKELDTKWQVSDFEAEHYDINDLLPENFIIATPASQGILQWLKQVYTSSRGFVLGTFDPSLLIATMHGQYQNGNTLPMATSVILLR